MRIFELTLRDGGCNTYACSIAITRMIAKFRRHPLRRLSPTVTWSISITLSLLFAAQGLTKFWGPAATQWASRFLKWGYPAGSSYVVGAVEIIAGLALLLPRTRKPAAGSLVVVMAGALCTHLIHGELPRVIPPLVLGVLAFLLFSSAPEEH